MEIRKDDITCPNGFPWITEENMTDKLRELGCRSSITSHYLRFAKLNELPDEWIEHHTYFLQTTIPVWMVKEYGEEIIPQNSIVEY
jgi:hypothetical protein